MDSVHGTEPVARFGVDVVVGGRVEAGGVQILASAPLSRGEEEMAGAVLEGVLG